MKIAIDAVGIRGHGGAAVLCELLHWLPTVRPDWRWHVFLFERNLREFDDPSVVDQIVLEPITQGSRNWSRLLWVNLLLQRRVKAIGADVIFSFANIGSFNPIKPQVVFCQQPNAFFNEANQQQPFFMRTRMLVLRQIILRGILASKATIVQTEAMRKRIFEFAPNLNGKMHVIPSGCPTLLNQYVIRPDKKALIERSGTPRLIYISAIRPPKNQKVLVKALPLILRIFPTASLLLTGDPENEKNHKERKLAAEIQQVAKELSVENHIVWLGLLNAREVDYGFRSSDLSFFPSLTESFGLPLVEAMAANCPITASDLPYAHDVAAEVAIYFNPYDAKSIADCAIRILQDDKIRQQLISKGTDRKKLFDYYSISNQIASVLESVAC